MVGSSAPPPPTGCTLGRQEKLKRRKDRWLLGLKINARPPETPASSVRGSDPGHRKQMILHMFLLQMIPCVAGTTGDTERDTGARSASVLVAEV